MIAVSQPHVSPKKRTPPCWFPFVFPRPPRPSLEKQKSTESHRCLRVEALIHAVVPQAQVHQKLLALRHMKPQGDRGACAASARVGIQLAGSGWCLGVNWNQGPFGHIFGGGLRWFSDGISTRSRVSHEVVYPNTIRNKQGKYPHLLVCKGGVGSERGVASD